VGQITLDDALIARLNELAQGRSLEATLEALLNLSQASPSPRGKMLELLAENTTDLICLHEPNGRYIYVSPSITTIGGYQPHELIGKNPYDYFHPDDLTHIQTSHNTSLRGQRTEGVAYRFRIKDGDYIWLETVTTPVLDTHGGVENLVTVSRDITQQQRTQEELRQERDLLSMIMETSPSGIIVVDHTGKISFSNRRAEEIVNLPKDEIGERSYDSVTWKHTDYEGNPWPDEKQPFVRVMQTKAPVWDVRHAIEWSNGRKVYLSINGAPMLDEGGAVSKVVFTIEDYTQRKLQQDELEAALENEKRLNEMQSAFIAVVSHEFRTPMSIIMTSTDMLRLKGMQMTREEFLGRLDKIEAQINRLNNLINDVTFINRADTVGHRLQAAPVDLREFFNNLADEMQMAYPSHHPLDVIHAGDCGEVLLDPALMQQVFINLISNAMKYSPSDSPVTCRYSCGGSLLMVAVRDQGRGIPPEDQPDLFKSFHRARNANGVAGTGLGLAIVKRALDTLGGTVRVESALDAGSTFTVLLPLRAAVTESNER
jgi:PAS domain S-box-containing protein